MAMEHTDHIQVVPLSLRLLPYNVCDVRVPTAPARALCYHKPFAYANKRISSSCSAAGRRSLSLKNTSHTRNNNKIVYEMKHTVWKMSFFVMPFHNGWCAQHTFDDETTGRIYASRLPCDDAKNVHHVPCVMYELWWRPNKKIVSGDYEETSATRNMLASQRDSWNAYECRALDAKHASAFHSGLGGRQQHCWCSDARNDKRLICAHCDDDTRRRRRRQNALFINTSYGILHIAHRHTIGLLRYAFWALLENVPQHKMWMWRTVERTCCTYSRHGPTH